MENTADPIRRERNSALSGQTDSSFLHSQQRSLLCWSQLNPDKMGTMAFDGNVISIKTAALQKAARLDNLTIVFFPHFLPVLSCAGTLPSAQDLLGLNK